MDESLENAFDLKKLKRYNDEQAIKRASLEIPYCTSIDGSSVCRELTDSGANIVCILKNKHKVLHAERGNTDCREVTTTDSSLDRDDDASSSWYCDIFESDEGETKDFEEMDSTTAN